MKLSNYAVALSWEGLQTGVVDVVIVELEGIVGGDGVRSGRSRRGDGTTGLFRRDALVAEEVGDMVRTVVLASLDGRERLVSEQWGSWPSDHSIVIVLIDVLIVLVPFAVPRRRLSRSDRFMSEERSMVFSLFLFVVLGEFFDHLDRRP